MKQRNFNKVDILNLVAGIVFFLIGSSNILIKEYMKGIIEISIGLYLFSPVIYKYIKVKSKK